jgi:predicted O-methyltransferase YrrM
MQQKRWEWISFLNILNHGERFKNVLEIGCYEGGTSVTLSYFTDNIYCVDVINPPMFNTSEFDPKCKFNYLVFNTQYQESIKAIKDTIKEVDFLMIDGDHTAQGAMNDYINYSPLVKDGGLIAFHDIVNTPHHRMLGCTVYQAWNEIKLKHAMWTEIITDNFGKPHTMDEISKVNDGWGGLGVVIK